MSEYDAFADIINQNNGIFADEAAGIEPGLGKFDGVRTAPTAEGVIVEMHCRGCGKPKRLNIEYPEMVAVKYNVPAHLVFQNQANMVGQVVEWRYSQPQGAWYPVVPCSNCHTPCAPLISSDEAERHLAVARRNGWISQQGEQVVSTACSAAHQQLAAAAGRRR